jgi:hypothetical protein
MALPSVRQLELEIEPKRSSLILDNNSMARERLAATLALGFYPSLAMMKAAATGRKNMIDPPTSKK